MKKTYGYLIAIEAEEGHDPYTDEIWDAIQDVPWKGEYNIMVTGVERLGEIDVYPETEPESPMGNIEAVTYPAKLGE